jgi:adenylate cyclase
MNWMDDLTKLEALLNSGQISPQEYKDRRESIAGHKSEPQSSGRVSPQDKAPATGQRSDNKQAQVTEKRANTKEKSRTSIFGPLSIRTLLVGLAVVEIVTAVGLTGWLAFRNGKQNADQLTVKVLGEMVLRVNTHLESYVNAPILLTELNKNTLDFEQIQLEDKARLEKHFWAQSQLFPEIAYFSFGYTDGEVVGVQVNDDGSTHVQVTENSGSLRSYSLDESGERLELLNTKENFDPRKRQWYTIPLSRNGPAWTPIYSWFSPPTLAMTFSKPYKKEGQSAWQGLLAFDLTLSQLSDYFRSLEIGHTGYVFLIEPTGDLVGTSGEAEPFAKIDGKVQRLKAGESPDRLIRDTARFLKKELGYPLAINQDVDLSFTSGSEKVFLRVSSFTHPSGLDWVIVVGLPESDFMGPIHANTRQTILLCLLILLLTIWVQVWSARRIGGPIVNLSRQVDKIKDFKLDNKFDINSPIQEVLVMSKALHTMQAGLHSFSRYVPSTLVRQLILKGHVAQPGGTQYMLTTMFTDITGFTSIAEELEPEMLMNHLSDYLDALSQDILAQNGTIDKYIGDAIMCFWGAPNEQEDQADRACTTALICQQTNARLNRQWQKEGRPALPTRMGIHTGISVVGNIGSNNRLNYTALGDNINLAARLEGINKLYGTAILISETTRDQVQDEYLTRPVDLVAVKGKDKGILIHELVAKSSSAGVLSPTPEQEDLCQRFGIAYQIYQSRQWKKAEEAFLDTLKAFPGDRLTRLYVQRCQAFLEDPPDKEWDGVFRMTTK